MTATFVDTHYFVASFQGTDQWHHRVVRIEAEVEGRMLVTTDAVLVEVLKLFF